MFFYLLLAEQTAQHAADLIQIDLCLDAVHDLLHLVVGQVDAQQAFHRGDGILLELSHQVLIALDLSHQLFDFCLDIHRSIPPCCNTEIILHPLALCKHKFRPVRSCRRNGD